MILHDIQKGKSVLMGFAILWVISCHYLFLADTPLSSFFSRGYLGVDIFILLSSFSLCFSLQKKCNYVHFIKRRLMRIIPMWWLLITVMLLINIVIGRHIPQTLFQLFCYYSGIGWWMFHNEPFGIYYYEWYIPTLLLFYLLLPLLYKLDNRKIFLVFILSIICVLFLLFFNIDKRLSLSYTRIPTFIYGIILYKMYNKEFKEDFTNKYLIISSLFGVLLLSMSIYYKGLSQTQTLGFMLVLPVFLYICCNLFKGVIGKVISFIGTLTLELYLLHIYDLPLIAVLKVINNKTIAIMIAVIILVGISYLLQYSMNRILSKVIKGNTI